MAKALIEPRYDRVDDLKEDTIDTQRMLSDLKHQRTSVYAKLRRIDARIADLRQQLSDLNVEEWHD